MSYWVLLRSLFSGCQSRRLLLLENLALRHQLAVLRRQTRKPKLGQADRLLWLTLRRLWPDWQKGLLLFQPQTVIAWHRLGFRLFWRWKSRARGGRPTADRKLINLIRQMWSSNPTWGSKRIQAELAKLGIAVSDSTVRKYRPRTRRGDQTWKTFLHTHAKELVSVDFFVVPTATFRVLYVFLVLAHERRKVLHFNITDSPSAAWTAQQLTEAFPYCNPPRYLLRDRDSIYGVEFVQRTHGLGPGAKAHCAAFTLAESLRRTLDRLHPPRMSGPRDRAPRAPLATAAHGLLWLLSSATARTGRWTRTAPESRAVEPPEQGNIIALPLLSGLHHRYTRQAA